MHHLSLALLLFLWLPFAAAQNCKDAPGPVVLNVPTAPTSVDRIEIGTGKIGLKITDQTVEVDGFVINATVKGTLVENDPGPVGCFVRFIGPLAAGTYEVRFFQNASNAQPSVSLVTTKQMVVSEAGRPIFTTVLPSYPTPDKPLSIRIRASTGGSPSIVLPHHATVSGDVIRIEGCVGDTGFAVPGIYVVSVGIPSLAVGRYRVEYQRAECRNDTGEIVTPLRLLTSFSLEVKNQNPEWPGPATPVMPVTEYRHAQFDHYFITADEDEQVALDSGRFIGWDLSPPNYGSSASKYGFYRENARPNLVPICRFFSASFAPKSSHFYTANAAECESVKANPDWTFEGVVGYVLGNGFCDGSSAPLYRLYNNGIGGAPNHKYTTQDYERNYYLEGGWVPEGVLGCVPVLAEPYAP